MQETHFSACPSMSSKIEEGLNALLLRAFLVMQHNVSDGRCGSVGREVDTQARRVSLGFNCLINFRGVVRVIPTPSFPSVYEQQSSRYWFTLLSPSQISYESSIHGGLDGAQILMIYTIKSIASAFSGKVKPLISRLTMNSKERAQEEVSALVTTDSSISLPRP